MKLCCRNAVDWLASLFNTPWGALNHCNVTFHDFITSEWGPGELSQHRAHGKPMPHCPKYEAPSGAPG